MKKVILNLGAGTLAKGCEAVLGEILEEDRPYPIRFAGSLPAAPDLAKTQRAWQQLYYARHRDQSTRIKVLDDGGIRYSQTAFDQLSVSLAEEFNDWLSAPSFRPVEQLLRTELKRGDDVQIIIETADEALRKLPWHLWQFFLDYSQAEITFGSFDWRSLPPTPETATQARVLAVFGNGEGIDISPDLATLRQLPSTDLTTLKSPSLSELHDRLWQPQGWDIFFFAGHSQTEAGAGIIDLNDEDRLGIDQIKYALSKAIEGGLKIAIFNSCDGLGLAQQLSALQIPYVVVMREPVPDEVAQQFLRYLLMAFAAGAPFHLAVREARSRLTGLEKENPGASWLPIIWQNPTAGAIYWRDLQRLPKEKVMSESSSQYRWHSRKSLAIKSLAASAVILGLRALGALVPLEMASYDQLMRSRPAELLDERIVVVEISQQATSEYGYPLPDEVLTALLDKAIAAKPLAIGLDVHRANPNPAVLESQTVANSLDPSNSGYERFLQQIEATPNLFVVCVYGNADENYQAPAGLSEALLYDQVGFSDLPIDSGYRFSLDDEGTGEIDTRGDVTGAGGNAVSGSKVRRHLLSYQPELKPVPSSCITPYSLSLQLAYAYLAAEEIAPIDVTDDQHWQFGSVVFQSLPERFGGYQNLEGASELMLNYRASQPAQRLTIDEVLSDEFDPWLLKDKVVLIGYTAPVSKDYFETPYGPMAGLWVHAHMVSQMLSAVLDGRSLITTLPYWRSWQWGDWLWVLAWGAGGGYLGYRVRRHKRWMMLCLLGGMALYGISWLGLVLGVWLPLVPSAAAATGATIWLRMSRDLRPEAAMLTERRRK